MAAKQFSAVTVGDQFKPKPKHLNKYKVSVIFMHGDADFYETEVIYLSDPAEVLDCINCIERCIAEYPYGRGGGDRYGYRHIEGYKEWSERICWPHSEMWDSSATPDDYTVTFIDQDGTEFKVSLK